MTLHAEPSVRAWLDPLVPAAARIQVADPGAPVEELYPEEEAAVVRAVEKRRREFTLGRMCARAALEGLGMAPAPIPVGPHREPVWPEGVVGSITHCRTLVAAVVAPGRAWAGLGLDAEHDRPLTRGVVERVCTEAERAWVSSVARDGELDPALLVFSAKEAVYKAIAPIARRWIGFQEVEVSMDAAAGRFRARYVGELPDELPDPSLLRGRFVARPDMVVSVAALPLHGVG